MKLTGGRIVFNLVNYTLLTFIAVITLYPFIHVTAVSLSDPLMVLKGEVGIIPKNLNIDAYMHVFKYPMLAVSYKNTFLYTLVGTFFNLLFTVSGAFALSRKKFYGKKLFMLMIIFCMLFNAGMIPNFLVIKAIGIYDTFWAMILPGCISMWYIIIMRTYFEQIPESMDESATIDGANDIQILAKIILPLSLPSVMAIGLFYAVDHWNAFFNALIYLKDQNRYPLQLILRQLVISNQAREMLSNSVDDSRQIGETIKYATIMIATLPILMVYPFIQKYFVKGVMIGAIKG